MKTKKVLVELKHHIPFTLIATAIAIIIVILIQYILEKSISEELFEIFHPLHVVASSIVTAGIYYKYKPKFIYALVIGITGSIIIGSLSDIVFPYLGGNLLNLGTSFHLAVLEKPILIFSAAIVGSIFGTLNKRTKMPHFVHVFLSVFASLFYLLVFSTNFNPVYLIGALVIVFIAVIIPCCISDIIFPFLFIKEKSSKR